MFLVAQPVRAQIISGVVKDGSGMPIPGATVMVKNTYTGVVADENGNWQLKTQPGKSILVISMLGYVTIEKEVGDKLKTWGESVFLGSKIH